MQRRVSIGDFFAAVTHKAKIGPVGDKTHKIKKVQTWFSIVFPMLMNKAKPNLCRTINHFIFLEPLLAKILKVIIEAQSSSVLAWQIQNINCLFHFAPLHCISTLSLLLSSVLVCLPRSGCEFTISLLSSLSCTLRTMMIIIIMMSSLSSTLVACSAPGCRSRRVRFVAEGVMWSPLSLWKFLRIDKKYYPTSWKDLPWLKT